MRILLVNLTRFGDLIQTQPALGGLAAAGHEVGMVCLENFAQTAGLVPDVSYLRPLPAARFLSALDKDWRKALGESHGWTAETAREFAPETVINLTPTLAARLLARHIAVSAGSGSPLPVEGFGMDGFGFSQESTDWATFLQSSSARSRGCSPFNVCDLFWKTAGLGDGARRFRLTPPLAESLAAADSLLGAPGPGGFVGLQLGASEDRRRWPVAHFAALGRALQEEAGVTPVICGSPGEKDLAERYRQAGGPGVNLAGKTGLPELAAAVSRFRLLVSNDTGTMHLAAGLGVPVLGIFLATAQPWDTGPYRAGSCSLEPDMDCHPCPFGRPCTHGEGCRRYIGPELPTALALHFLEQGAWPEHPQRQARVWRSEVEADGSMGLRSLSGHEETDRTRWIRLQRVLYSRFLDRAPAPEAAGAGLSLSPAAMETVRRELNDSLGLLTLLEEQSRLLALAPREALKTKFLAMWRKLHALWDQSDYFNVLGHLWSTQSQSAGEDLAAVQAALARYRALIEAWRRLLSC